jgi:hypothetical protein
MRLNDEAAPLARPHRYSMSDFKKLKVWQKAHDMSLLANTIAKQFARPTSENCVLSSSDLQLQCLPIS